MLKNAIPGFFPTLHSPMSFRRQDDIYDTIQTMNISQSLNVSLILLVVEAVNLFTYLYVDFHKLLLTPFSIAVTGFLLFLAGNMVYCKHLLTLARTEKTRRLLKRQTYCFTIVFSLFCLAVNYICLKSRMTAESLVMFYIFIAAGPIYSPAETLSAILLTTVCSIPSFLYQGAPPTLYSALFRYCFISFFLSQMRCRTIAAHLFQLRKAWDEQITLQNLADNDPLTQLLNRNGYSLRLKEVLPHAIRLKLPAAVIMVDIDYFKQFNDAFGHMAGDECLKKAASALAANIHQGKDLICRFGGEEFQIFLCGIHPSDAVKVADRLRQSVADLKIPAANQSAGPYVTISLGVAAGVLSSMAEYHQLVKEADQELYYAKRHGKNRISFRNLSRSFPDKLKHTK